MTAPYWSDDTVTLYVGDCREVLPALDVAADLVVADPPYGETSLAWDRWPDGWLDVAATVSRSLWCFGSMRMFGERWIEFGSAGWKLSQDIVWEKNAGAGLASDRFRRIHEHASHWYREQWGAIHHDAQRTQHYGPREGVVSKPNRGGPHLGSHRPVDWSDDGTRLMTSVIKCKNMRARAIHPTEKPLGILDPLIRYACPPGGLVIDPFAGSGGTLDAARQSGRKAIGIEGHEPYAERAARRLEQMTLDAS